MVKIVNGVVVSDNGTAAGTDSSTSSSSATTGGDGYDICGFKVTGWMIVGLLVLSLFLNGPKGLVFCGTILGAAYIFTNWSSAGSGSSSSTSASSYRLSGGGGPNIRTVKDLPKTPAKSC
jgi:hypothetical protein